MDLGALLLASLQPQSRQNAETQLNTLSMQPGFLIHLLQLVLDSNQLIQTRQAAGVYFKNNVKRRWDGENDEPTIADPDKAALREQLVRAMISLSSPADKRLRAQIGEAVAAAAEVDFPERWPDLIDQLVSSLSAQDYSVNIGVLETAHSIFSRWRSQIRSDTLYSTINYVISRFQDPFVAMFHSTAMRLLQTPPSGQELIYMAQTQSLLVSIYYDLVAQDIPPVFEDNIAEYFGVDGGDDGWLLKLLKWNPAELQGDAEDPTPTIPLETHNTVLEIAEIFAVKYNELFAPRLPAFVRAVWEVIGASTLAVREDTTVSQAIKFLSITVKTGLHTQLFSQQETLELLIERIVLPNMLLRDHEIEQFEDDPLEYIRRDLSVNTEGQTRRHSAADLLKALISNGLEREVTTIVERYVAKGLEDYSRNPRENWKSKDTAVYLLAAIAARGTTSHQGVTSANILVDIVKFFSDHIAQDLQATAGSVHPILQVDAIRFLYTFRYQLTKEQLLAVLPLLARHLESDNYVSYTYAAITIERILFVKQGNQLLFSQADIHEFAHPILMALFAKIEAGRTPEKIAENDYLMKCVMRVIITARQTLAPVFATVLEHLVGILGSISQNPSNPNFNQYCFESISALMRFIVATNPATLPEFEKTLFGPFTYILQQDIDLFIPYVFQILSQMLELQQAGLPDAYRSLLPLLLTPAPWQQKGSIPGLVRLLRAFLVRDAPAMCANGQIKTILAVAQQRLIPSKINDVYGYELLQAVVTSVPIAELQKYFRDVLMSLLTRLQSTRTDRFASGLALFFSYIMAVQANDLSPDFLISAVENIQPQLWSSFVSDVILPEILKTQPRDRKLVVVALTRLLTRSQLMLTEPSIRAWPNVLTTLLTLFASSHGLSKRDDQPDEDTLLNEIDYEEATAGYQASYSKLAASESARPDPVAYVPDPTTFVVEELARAVREDTQPNRIKTLIASVDGSLSGPFMQLMASKGHAI